MKLFIKAAIFGFLAALFVALVAGTLLAITVLCCFLFHSPIGRIVASVFGFTWVATMTYCYFSERSFQKSLRESSEREKKRILTQLERLK